MFTCGIQHVTLGYAPASAAACNVGRVDVVLRCCFLRRRHDGCTSALSWRWRSSLRRGRCWGTVRYCSRGSFGINLRNDFFARDGAAAGLDNAHQHAFNRRGCFKHDLVGFNIDQVFVALHHFALLAMPRQQRGFGNRLRQLRHFDFNDHKSPYSHHKVTVSI